MRKKLHVKKGDTVLIISGETAETRARSWKSAPAEEAKLLWKAATWCKSM